MNNAVQTTASKRNYSFLHRKQDSLDAVSDGNVEFIIPAIPGTTYWAILRYCYENHDKPMRMKDIVDGTARIYEDRDPDKWNLFKTKRQVRTLSHGSIIQKDANSWRKRLETNIKTLTRHSGNNPYGKRLIERGHILRWEPDHFDGKGGYVLRTTTNQPLLKQRKTKKGSQPVSP